MSNSLPKNPLVDGSYLSWIYPSGKLRKKGSQPILVRIIEYTIEHPDNPEEQLTYRLITSLLDIERFSAELLAREYHQRWEVENTIDELKINTVQLRPSGRNFRLCRDAKFRVST